jgi:hypothetical protein
VLVGQATTPAGEPKQARHDTGQRGWGWGWGGRACLRLLRGAGGIAVMPLAAHPLACACLNGRVDRQAKFRDTVLRMQTRGGALLSIAKGQGPGTRILVPCRVAPCPMFPVPCPQPRRIDIIAQGLSQPHWTTIQTPPTPSQHQPTTPSLFKPPPPGPHKRTPIDYRLAQTTHLFARPTSHLAAARLCQVNQPLSKNFLASYRL